MPANCVGSRESPDVTAGEPNCHWVNRGDIAQMKQSDWCRQLKSGGVKGHKRWWPEQLPNIQSMELVSVSDATWPTGRRRQRLIYCRVFPVCVKQLSIFWKVT